MGFVPSDIRRRPPPFGYKNLTVLPGHLRSLFIPFWWIYLATLFSVPAPIRPLKLFLYTSDEGFGEIDLLFTIQPPDFLTFVCPDSKIDDKQFASIISRVDRWMQDRFITTLICSRDDTETGQHMASELIGDLRRISSQVVWVSDGRDLREVLTALRFFS